MRKEILNICFNLYLVIALGKCAKPSSVLLRSIYNLLRSREGMQKGEDRVHDMKHSHIILPEKNQNCCRLQIFFKTNVLKIFCNIRRETTALESLFGKVACLKACNSIRKRLKHMYFTVNIAKFSRTAFFTELFGGCFRKINSK